MVKSAAPSTDEQLAAAKRRLEAAKAMRNGAGANPQTEGSMFSGAFDHVTRPIEAAGTVLRDGAKATGEGFSSIANTAGAVGNQMTTDLAGHIISGGDALARGGKAIANTATFGLKGNMDEAEASKLKADAAEKNRANSEIIKANKEIRELEAAQRTVAAAQKKQEDMQMPGKQDITPTSVLSNDLTHGAGLENFTKLNTQIDSDKAKAEAAAAAKAKAEAQRAADIARTRAGAEVNQAHGDALSEVDRNNSLGTAGGIGLGGIAGYGLTSLADEDEDEEGISEKERARRAASNLSRKRIGGVAGMLGGGLLSHYTGAGNRLANLAGLGNSKQTALGDVLTKHKDILGQAPAAV